jgi:hypothetical protein
MQPHIHEFVPCRLVLQLRTYRCSAVNRRFGPMLLKKVFRGVERIFSEALVPWSENDVGDT